MKKRNIDSEQAFDFGKTASFYAKYRDTYPDSLYMRLRELGVAAPDSSWLDLGTGTGVLPKHLYRPDVKVFGADLSAEQIRFAKEQAAKDGQNITYLVCPAEQTGLPDHAFDCITAAQCFWYFDRDRMKTEIIRLLKPGGMFVKIYMDFDYTDPVAKQSIALVQNHNPAWSPQSTGAQDIFDDLFPERKTETFEADLPFTRESWHGRMLACRGTLASMQADALATWKKEHQAFINTLSPSFTVHHTIYISSFILP